MANRYVVSAIPGNTFLGTYLFNRQFPDILAPGDRPNQVVTPRLIRCATPEHGRRRQNVPRVGQTPKAGPPQRAEISNLHLCATPLALSGWTGYVVRAVVYASHCLGASSGVCR